MKRVIIPSVPVAEAPSSSSVVDVAAAALVSEFNMPMMFEEAAAGGPAVALYRGTDCAHKVPVFGPKKIYGSMSPRVYIYYS